MITIKIVRRDNLGTCISSWSLPTHWFFHMQHQFFLSLISLLDKAKEHVSHAVINWRNTMPLCLWQEELCNCWSWSELLPWEY